MTSRQFVDRISIEDAPRRTGDGYLVTMARVSRAGIYHYRGSEVGMPDREIVRVWRPESEVFSTDALKSFTHLPITVGHPKDGVNSKNWRQHARGYTGEEVLRDGSYLRVPLIVKDEDAINRVDTGERELSCGYTADYDPTPGVVPKGEIDEGKEYDAIQRALRGNHLAIVKRGRAGSECRIGDEDDDDNGETNMADNIPLKTVTVDGIGAVQVNETASVAIAHLEGKLKEHKTTSDASIAALNTSVADKDKEIARLSGVVATKDKELGERDAKIIDLEKKVADTASIDKLVNEKADVLSKAKSVVGDALDFNGKTVPEIRRAVVAKKYGDEMVKDKADPYVEALFDAAALAATKDGSNPPRDTFADSMREAAARNGNGNPRNVEEAHRAMISDMESAYQSPASTGTVRH